MLEIGTGSGYQAAVLSPLVKEVYTIEIVESLGKHAQQTLKRLKYANVFVKIGDGYLGWPEHAPFDKIIVTCSPEKVPQPLIDQLKEGGRMIIPVGERYQQVFHLLKKQDGKLINEALRPTLFVPMTGKAEESREVQPDPLHPKLINGGFEEVDRHRRRTDGLVLCPPDESRDGARRPRRAELRDLLEHRARPRPAGRCKASRSTAARSTNWSFPAWSAGPTGAGPGATQAAQFAVLFLDDNHATVGQVALGPWRGSFDWKRVTGMVSVPAAPRGDRRNRPAGRHGRSIVRRRANSSEGEIRAKRFGVRYGHHVHMVVTALPRSGFSFTFPQVRVGRACESHHQAYNYFECCTGTVGHNASPVGMIVIAFCGDQRSHARKIEEKPLHGKAVMNYRTPKVPTWPSIRFAR